MKASANKSRHRGRLLSVPNAGANMKHRACLGGRDYGLRSPAEKSSRRLHAEDPCRVGFGACPRTASARIHAVLPEGNRSIMQGSCAPIAARWPSGSPSRRRPVFQVCEGWPDDLTDGQTRHAKENAPYRRSGNVSIPRQPPPPEGRHELPHGNKARPDQPAQIAETRDGPFSRPDATAGAAAEHPQPRAGTRQPPSIYEMLETGRYSRAR